MLKLPGGDWLNLATIARVLIDEETGSVITIWENGTRARYSGAQARAILEALNESEFIDKSEVGVEEESHD